MQEDLDVDEMFPFAPSSLISVSPFPTLSADQRWWSWENVVVGS